VAEGCWFECWRVGTSKNSLHVATVKGIDRYMKCASLPVTVALQARAPGAIFSRPKDGILGSNPICHMDVIAFLILYDMI